MRKAIQPYFNYYLRKYPPEIFETQSIITIPMKDGSRSLDDYYIKPLLENGYKYHEYFLLKEIYLIKQITPPEA